MIAPCLGVVVFLPGASVEVEEPLEPLDELEIVLVLRLGEFFNLDVLLDVALLEGLLQNLEVLDKLPLVARAPVYFAYLDPAWEHGVEDLAVHSPRAELLDLYQVQVQETVGPVEQIRLRNEEGSLHHAYTLVGHLKAMLLYVNFVCRWPVSHKPTDDYC